MFVGKQICTVINGEYSHMFAGGFLRITEPKANSCVVSVTVLANPV